MKRIVRYLLLIIISIVTINANALRISRYEATYEIDPETNGSQVVMYFGYRGEFGYTTTFNIEYDSTLLELTSIVPTEGFTYENEEKTLSSNEKKNILTFTANYSIDEILYGAIVFNMKKPFTVGTTTELKVTDVITQDDSGKKYRSKGYYLELKRETNTKVSVVRNDMSKETDQKKLLDKLLPFIIVIIAAFFLIIFIILLMPTGKREDRTRTIKKQIDSDKPQADIRPLPKFAEKKKRDVIKSDEEVIQPLSQFVSKDKEINKEKMDKPLETSNNVFENNPTKQGKEGLININPLAFDDSSDDDDIDTLE